MGKAAMLSRSRILVAGVLGLVVVSAVQGTASAAAPFRGTEESGSRSHPIVETFDVHYHDASSRQVLDIFAPADLRRTPVVVFVHGGTWMAGDKNFFGLYRGVGRFLARNGVTAVLVNYRLSPQVRHPEHARDVARALAWTFENIDRYGGDPDQVILCGHSAGGHLATLVALDDHFLSDPALKLDPARRKKLKAIIGVSGVYRIPSPEEFDMMLPHIVKCFANSSWMESVLLRVGHVANPFSMVFGSDPSILTQASPIQHIHKGLPPFLLLHATAEAPGLAQQAVDFAVELRKAGTNVRLQEIPDSNHRSILFKVNEADDPAGKALLGFIREVTASSRQG
jgi:acetyl esterase/lipase